MNTGAQVFDIEGVQFVSGLFWQPLSESSNGDKKDEVKSLSSELKLELYVLRNTSISCVGLTNPNEEIKSDQCSIAAIVSKTLEIEQGASDFIFVTPMYDGKWIYISQRDGLILPDGDKVYPSEDAARARMLEDMSIGDWSTIIAPSIWGIRGSSERTFESMIPRNGKGKIKVHKWWKLKNVDSNKELAKHKGKILISLLLVVAAGLGINKYKEVMHQKEMDAAEAAAKELMMSQNQQAVVMHPWKDMPLSTNLLQACMGAISTVRLFPGNWELVSANCSNTALTVSWKPKGENGWIEHLRQIHPDSTISLDGSLASVTKLLTGIEAGVDEEVLPENMRLVEMYSAAQRYGFKFTATPAAPAVQALPGQEAAVVAQKDYRELNWKAENIMFPEAVLSGLSGNGMRMTAMNAIWQNGKFVWTMEGIQYVK